MPPTEAQDTTDKTKGNQLSADGVAAYEKLATRTKELLEDSKDKLKTGGENVSEWLDSALETAREQLEKTGELTQEEGQALKGYLKRDLEATKEDFDRMGEWFVEKLDPARVAPPCPSCHKTTFRKSY